MCCTHPLPSTRDDIHSICLHPRLHPRKAPCIHRGHILHTSPFQYCMHSQHKEGSADLSAILSRNVECFLSHINFLEPSTPQAPPPPRSCNPSNVANLSRPPGLCYLPAQPWTPSSQSQPAWHGWSRHPRHPCLDPSPPIDRLIMLERASTSNHCPAAVSWLLTRVLSRVLFVLLLPDWPGWPP